MKLDPGTLVARFGEAGARRLFDLSLESIDALERLIADEAIACDYQRTGHLQAAAKPSHFQAFREEQALLARVFDHRVELVSRADQGAELGSDAYHGVLVDERSGAINPAKYVEGLAGAARQAGATIASHTRVERFSRAGSSGASGRWIVTTSTGSIDAGDVLVATNGYTNGAAPELRRRLIRSAAIIATGRCPRAMPRRCFRAAEWRSTRRTSSITGADRGSPAAVRRPRRFTPGSDTTRRAASILHAG